MKEITSNKILKNNLKKQVIIHYSCSDIEEKYPSVSSISVFDTKFNLAKTFSRDTLSQKDEIKTLEEFFTFISKKIDNDFVLVGWFWGEKYGIIPIINRYKQLTKQKPRINTSKLKYVDLLTIFRKEYKDFFGGFKILAEYNGFNLEDLIEGHDELKLYKKGEFQKLNTSTSIKVEIFHNFIQRHVNQTLQIPKLEEVFYALKDIGSYPAFNDNISKIRSLLNVKNIKIEDPELQHFLRNLLFANLVTAMEAYLSDTFIRKGISKNKYIRRYLKIRFNSRVREGDLLKDMFKEVKNDNSPYLDKYIVKKCIEDMKSITFHNLNMASDLYKKVLDIEFPKNIGELYKAVETRHHLIHRNGKDKHGRIILIKVEELKKLITSVDKFVSYIHTETKKLK